MPNKLTALFKRSKEKGGDQAPAAYPLPFSGGSIPGSWPWNWWQQGRNPVSSDATSIVHACADAYAQTIASIPAFQWRYEKDGTKERVINASSVRTLYQPNSYQTRSDLFLNLVKGLMLEGNAYLVGFRNDREEINQVHQLPAKSTVPMIEPISKAVFYAAGDNPLVGEIDYLIPQRDICHIRLYTPNNPLVGVSPIVNAAASVAANSAITSHQATFFNNMSRPSGVLSTETKLTQDQMRQLRAAWEEQSSNMNAGGIPILGGGLKWDPMSINSQDAQLVDAFNMTVEDVARAFRVPLPLVNDNRHSTYNNIEQLISHWLSGGLGFVLEHIETNLDKFFAVKPSDKIEFNVDALLRTDFQGRVESYSKSIQYGLLSPNEARNRFDGLEPVPYGDQPIVQQQMVPLGWHDDPANQPEPEPEPEPEPMVDEEEEKQNTIYYMERALANG